MKAVPRKQLWRCRYHCSDYRGILVFFALTIPVAALLMGWIDGTGLKKLPLSLTVTGVGVIVVIVLFILISLRRAEYNYFEAIARAAAGLEAETPEELAMELEENRGARLKSYILRDPEKLFLTGKILLWSARNRAIGQKMITIAIEYAPELKEFENLEWRDAAKRYIALQKK
ncbi:MAG: hypothetical protein IKD44_00590 [Lentisphaeria bacterium]|nr:hypothetical protein [Lentisphaeria bacterium]